MDLDETFKGSYIVMDNASIHKCKPMLQKIESKGYKVMYLIVVVVVVAFRRFFYPNNQKKKLKDV